MFMKQWDCQDPIPGRLYRPNVTVSPGEDRAY